MAGPDGTAGGKPDPGHPSFPQVETLRRVDLSGGASTIATDRMTVGELSKLRAIGSAFTPQPATAGSALLEAYQRWRAQQERGDREVAAIKADIADVTKSLDEFEARRARVQRVAKSVSSANIEKRALRKSIKRTSRVLDTGANAATALQAGHRHYRKHGGTSTFATWRAKIARG